MKLALVGGKKTKASKGERGICPSCGSELIAKCGEIKVNHWAHKGTRNCDPWWESETEWHRSWKKHFPMEWQEEVHKADNGEKHIADVKTEQDWVIEFQHSYLKPEERRSRNAFYPKLVWVIDGMRRKRDKKQFQKVLEETRVLNREPDIYEVFFPEECRLLDEWFDSTGLVFFDFQGVKGEPNSNLWFLLPEISDSKAYLMTISRNNFIKYHQDNRFEKLYKNQISSIRKKLIKKNKKRNKLSPREMRRRNQKVLNFE